MFSQSLGCNRKRGSYSIYCLRLKQDLILSRRVLITRRNRLPIRLSTATVDCRTRVTDAGQPYHV